MKKMIVVAACLLLLPMAALAADVAAPAAPSEAAIAACKDKKAGDKVELDKAAAVCTDEKGVLVAVPEAAKK